MRILFFGDICARAGRDAIKKHLPTLKDFYKPTLIIANAENLTNGHGTHPKDVDELFKMGVQVLTGGNHSFDKKEFINLISTHENILRPHNLSNYAPGKGYYLHSHNNEKVLIINLIGRLFMENFTDCPFQSLAQILKKYPLGGQIKAIFVDFHAEATSEKLALAHYFDGQVTAVIGTHTHIPTNDATILKNGTAIQCDAGMCGDYNSVIGFKVEGAIAKFLKFYPKIDTEPADGEGTVCGVVIEVDGFGKARAIQPFAIGPWVGKALIPLGTLII